MKIPITLFALAITLVSALAADTAGLIKTGDALDQQLKTKEALAVFVEADQADPGNAEILYRLAKQYGLSMNDAGSKSAKIAFGEKALDAAKRAVKADPKNSQAQLALAVSYGRLALLLDNKTKIEYSRLIEKHALLASQLDPKNDLAWHVLGAWSYGMANLNGVMRTFAKMIYGELPNATNEEAAVYFEKAIALNPNRIGNHVELGRTYAALGQDAKARAEFEKALALPNKEKDDPEAKQRAREALAKL